MFGCSCYNIVVELFSVSSEIAACVSIKFGFSWWWVGYPVYKFGVWLSVIRASADYSMILVYGSYPNIFGEFGS